MSHKQYLIDAHLIVKSQYNDLPSFTHSQKFPFKFIQIIWNAFDKNVGDGKSLIPSGDVLVTQTDIVLHGRRKKGKNGHKNGFCE